jgi:hypothetical protein
MTALQGGACGITSARSGLLVKLPPSKTIPVMPGLVPGIHVFLAGTK